MSQHVIPILSLRRSLRGFIAFAVSYAASWACLWIAHAIGHPCWHLPMCVIVGVGFGRFNVYGRIRDLNL